MLSQRSIPFQIILISLLITGFSISGYARGGTRISLADTHLAKSEREAILILPGLGDSRKGRNAQEEFFSNRGYDVYIPDFLDRKSFESSVANLANFYEEYGLNEYRKVHAFCYILGAFAINRVIDQMDHHNIATIVYDRSPLQERAPRVVVDRISVIGQIAAGKVVKDFSTVEYLPMTDTSVQVGILIESKATVLIKTFKNTALSYGPVSWEPEDLNQFYDDHHYTWLNHAQMYTRFDVIGDEVMSFIRYGKFTNNAVKEPYNWDHFKKYREKEVETEPGSVDSPTTYHSKSPFN